MNNTSIKLPIILILIFFLIVGVLAYQFITAEELVLVDTAVEAPVGEVGVNNQQEVVLLPTMMTKTDTKLVMRDFLLDEDVELIDEEAQVYRIGSELGQNGTLFEIFYFKGGGGGISISLLDPNLVFVRARAEAALQERLDVSLLRLCALKVVVTVPRTVSPVLTGTDYSGINLGLPSCPGSFVF